MARSIRDSDADDIVRSKIPTIREVEDSGIITGAGVVYNQLSGTGELAVDATTKVKIIQIANTHLTLDTYVTLSIRRNIDPPEIYIIKRMLLPIGTAVVFEGTDIVVEVDALTVAVADQVNYIFQLYTASGTPTVDIIMRS